MTPPLSQTPPPDELAQQVVDLLAAEDRTTMIETITEHGGSAGMAMLSLAHIASRHLALLAAQMGATVVARARWASGRPMETDDPREFATLLLALAANDDRGAMLDIVRQVLALGREHTKITIEILAAMAEDTLKAHFMARQNPSEN